ncbi:MAG: hypothetical protein AAF547_07570 [Actinomycetota bacterium]
MLPRRTLPLLFVIFAIAGACGGGPSEETARLAFAERFPDVGPVATSCLTDQYLQQLPVSDFATAAGEADPDAVEAAVREQPDLVGACVDLSERLADQLRQGDRRLEADCVTGDQLVRWPLLEALLDADDAVLAADGQAREQLLDAVGQCVDQRTFAALAGLDDPDELAEVLVADPFAESSWLPAQDPCVVRAAIDGLGIARLAELGVDLASPDLLGSVGLTEGDLDLLVESLVSCDLEAQLIRAVSVSDAPIAECVIESVPEADWPDLARSLYRGREVLDHPAATDLVDPCVDEAIEGLYIPVDPGELTSDERDFIVAFNRELNWTTDLDESRYTLRCTSQILPSIASGVDFEAMLRYDEAVAAGEEPATADWEVAFEFSYAAIDFGTICFDPWVRLVEDLDASEIDDALHPCLRHEIDRRVLEQMMAAVADATMYDDPWAWEDLEAGHDEVRAALEICGEADDVRRWDHYLGDLFDFGSSFEDPDPDTLQA